MRKRFVNFYSQELLRRCDPRKRKFDVIKRKFDAVRHKFDVVNNDGLSLLYSLTQRRPSLAAPNLRLQAQLSNQLFSDFVPTKHDIINSSVCLKYSIYAGFGKINLFYEDSDSSFGKSNLFYKNSDSSFGKSNLFYEDSDSSFGKPNLFYENSDSRFGISNLFYENSDSSFGISNICYANPYCLRERFVNFYTHGLLRRCAPRKRKFDAVKRKFDIVNDVGLSFLCSLTQRRPSLAAPNLRLRAQRSNLLISDFVSTKHDIINSYVCSAYSIYADFGKSNLFHENRKSGFDKSNLFHDNRKSGFDKSNLFHENRISGFDKSDLFHENRNSGFGKSNSFHENRDSGFGKSNRISDCLISNPFPVK
jgi:hypothetical protein